jgi:hypothetical protein
MKGNPMDGYDAAENARQCYEVGIAACRDKLASFRKEVIGECTLYLGDCREILPLLPKVDAVVSDPPYGISLQTDNRWREAIDPGKRKVYRPVHGDDESFDPTFMLKLAPRVTLWGANHYADKLPPSRGWLVWNKRDAGASGMHSDAELAWTNAIGATRCHNQFWQGAFRPGEVAEGFLHPTQKALALMRWCVELTSRVGDTVLDPFMGSGSTLLACVKLQRRAIGIEIDQGYFDIACRRIEEAYKQPDMFVAPPQPKAEQVDMGALLGFGT